MNLATKLAVVVFALVGAPVAQASLIGGFESGLTGWDYLGDVSIQTSAIGVNPTQGHNMAFVSTMCDRYNPPTLVQDYSRPCQTTVNEHPYSGVSSPSTDFAREFIGLPFSTLEFLQVMPERDWGGGLGVGGEGGALRTRFYAHQAGQLSFDWNWIGEPADNSFLSVWSDDSAMQFHEIDWLYEFVTYGDLRTPSDVHLCERYYNEPSDIDRICNPISGQPFFSDYETGWQTRSIEIPKAGWYWLGLGLGEIAEGTQPSVLAVDNVRYNVPEPNTLALLALGLAGMGLMRRRRQV